MDEKTQAEQLIVCGGCNAKIGPGNLAEILKKLPTSKHDKNLLVGYESTDDAAVYQIDRNTALIQTLDFFPSMVNDPYLFGKIAAANALSDVFAMGGDVLTALNIVCFPENMDVKILERILKGGAEKVSEAGGILAGGHSIHDRLPKYGLSVMGRVAPDKILKNNTVADGDVLILTKPLGVGIVTTSYGAGEASEAAFNQAVASMTTLNKYAADIIRQYSVSSCTDVTGFGLAGHLSEMLHGEFKAQLTAENIPMIPEAYNYAEEFLITAGGQRNRNYLKGKIEFNLDDYALEEIVFDPQTSGGLLVSVPASVAPKLLQELNTLELQSAIIGHVTKKASTDDVEIVVN
ncbi:selenide, water dikinase SelD [Loigolactobacillus backii]|uniref:selenide, water dikinase SelD n=1 Tax=Loigolactobacillus backii TaxID=375175 RepID=UPI000C1CB02D|nr:selenide, water dikinase SelD [Loigolactobacillus backii]MDA5386813.1 selenide, water dikinase SelD [Loigolactobacillus backii]MDA5389402.1 selenide, water dikinase SelD [Loigolactobacillus backii]PIO82475.1 selenide, water dikinase SelD [Loigolactobacillus backii]